VVDVVVSVLCRIIFDFALWSDRTRARPVLVVCEEAHRYIPAAEHLGFESTRRAITRIAKEGRKYGVSLCLVTQRPSELSPSILSQCGTLFALRMNNEQDQTFVGRALPENAHRLLSVLPELRVQEALVVGEGVSVPMRVRLDTLPPEHQPRSESARFSELWLAETSGPEFVGETIHKWRHQIR
jgi:DNA helicase HerA-like ATPase